MSDAPLVLVVDDDASVASAASRLLRRSGYSVEVAPDGHSALARLREIRAAVMLLDLHMPGVDGLAVLRATRDLPAMPAVLLTSGGATNDEIDAAMAAGAAAHLAKPWRTHDLVAAVGRLLGRAPSLQRTSGADAPRDGYFR